MAEEKTTESAVAADEFIREHSKMSDTKKRSVTKADYLNYMSSAHGLNRQHVEAVSQGNRELISGAISVTAADLADKIKAAKKDGNDPADLDGNTSITTADGQIKVRVQAQTTNRSPQTGEQIVKHGRTSVRVITSNAVLKEPSADAQALIGKLMGD